MIGETMDQTDVDVAKTMDQTEADIANEVESKMNQPISVSSSPAKSPKRGKYKKRQEKASQKIKIKM